jgi:hypothetical protein
LRLRCRRRASARAASRARALQGPTTKLSKLNGSSCWLGLFSLSRPDSLRALLPNLRGWPFDRELLWVVPARLRLSDTGTARRLRVAVSSAVTIRGFAAGPVVRSSPGTRLDPLGLACRAPPLATAACAAPWWEPARVESVFDATLRIGIVVDACMDRSRSTACWSSIGSPFATPKSFMHSISIELLSAPIEPELERAACQQSRITSA